MLHGCIVQYIRSFPSMLMASETKGTIVVVMGVSGAGKSTVGDLLAKEWKCSYLDADEFHSQANIGIAITLDFVWFSEKNLIRNVNSLVEKMRQGIPLTDDDRKPWLENMRDVLRERRRDGSSVVLGCSSLKKEYREILRSADAESVKFVFLKANPEVLIDRLKKRTAEGKHFMPVKLLQSQLDLLQVEQSEGILTVDATLSPSEVIENILSQSPL